MRRRVRPTSLVATILLTMLVGLGPISTDLYLPSLPSLKDALNASTSAVQWTLSAFMIGFGVSQLLYGAISDRFGRRPAILGGLVLYVAATIGCALALSIDQLIAARLAQAIGACCGPVVARAVVRDVYPPDRGARVMAYMGAAMALAPAIGPILGGQLHDLFGWRSNFAVLALFGTVGLVGILLILPETNQHKDPTATSPARILRNWAALIRHRLYIGYVLTIGTVFAGLFSFISGSSFVLIDFLGVEPASFGFYFAVIVGGYIAGSLTSGRLSARLGIPALALTGAILTAAAGAAMLGLALLDVRSVAAVIAPQTLYMVGVGMVIPNAMAGAVGPFPRMAGAASALLGFVQMTLGAGAGAVVGELLTSSALPMAAAVALGGMGALASVVFLVLPAMRASRMAEAAGHASTEQGAQ